MPSKFLHMVAFNIPYPADYGGVIDIYYKIKALKKAGVRVILHCFEYGRKPVKELEDLCFRMHCYPRKSGLLYMLKRIPYIVATRNAKSMPENLFNDPFPVLFEGIHTTGLLHLCGQAGKKSLVRTHNIEHEYYARLARSETHLFRKGYLWAEARKLRRYEGRLTLANHLLAISRKDAQYFGDRYGNTLFIPPFHRFEEVTAIPGTGDYILFHGNLSVPENSTVATFLLRRVFPDLRHRVIIAGKDPPARLVRMVLDCPRTELIDSPDDVQMERLISGAQLNILVTRQSTGLKLKLLHALHAGRHCLANRAMVEGTGLEALCHIADTPEEMVRLINELMEEPFTEQEVRIRRKTLEDYSNRVGAEKILRLMG